MQDDVYLLPNRREGYFTKENLATRTDRISSYDLVYSCCMIRMGSEVIKVHVIWCCDLVHVTDTPLVFLKELQNFNESISYESI